MNPSAIHAEDAVQIRDVHLPLSPEIWPPAPGWWALAVIVIILLFWTISRLRRLRRRNKLQKEILASLNELQREYSVNDGWRVFHNRRFVCHDVRHRRNREVHRLADAFAAWIGSSKGQRF